MNKWNIYGTSNIDVKELSSEDIAKLIQDIFNQISEGKFEEISQEIERMDIADVNVLYLVAILRCTFVWRYHIDTWKPLLDKMYPELDRRGMDTENILQGLKGCFDDRKKLN